jgi:hypothetical protein
MLCMEESAQDKRTRAKKVHTYVFHDTGMPDARNSLSHNSGLMPFHQHHQGSLETRHLVAYASSSASSWEFRKPNGT